MKTRSGQPVWRAWTTDHETCLNAVEFPQEAYGAAQNVIRAVYNDDPTCVSYWERMAKGSPQALEEAMHKGLVKLFAHNNTTTPVTIPHAAKTFYWLWKGGCTCWRRQAASPMRILLTGRWSPSRTWTWVWSVRDSILKERRGLTVPSKRSFTIFMRDFRPTALCGPSRGALRPKLCRHKQRTRKNIRRFGCRLRPLKGRRDSPGRVNVNPESPRAR